MAGVLAYVATSASGQANAEDLLDEGARYAKAGDSESAVRAYEQVVERDPWNLDAQDRLATHRIALGRLEEVVAQLEPVVARRPDRSRALYLLAYCYRKTGRASEAVRAYANYLKLRPADPDPYYGYALALRDLRDADAALRTFKAYVAMERRPEEGAWVAKAEAMIRELEAGTVAAEPEVPGAADIERLRTRVRDHPEDAVAWEGLAAALSAGGRSREAEAARRQAERKKSGKGKTRGAPATAASSVVTAGEPLRPEQVDELLPLRDTRVKDEDGQRRTDEARQARAERRKREADQRLLRAERARLARAETRRLRAEKAAKRKADREEAIAARRARREESKAAQKEKREQREAAVSQAGASPAEIAPGEPEGAPAVSDEAQASAAPPPEIPPGLGSQDIERLRTAVRDDPEDSRSWFLLAAALRSGGRLAEAGAAERKYTRLRSGISRR